MSEAEMRQFIRDNLSLEVSERPFMMPWTEVRLMLRNDPGGWEAISTITIDAQECSHD